LWDVLRASVRRHGDPEDGRLLVADSKLVYSPARGLLALETGALVLLGQVLTDVAPSLSACVNSLCPDSHGLLAGECWYVGDTELPLVAQKDDIAAAGARFRQICARRRLVWGVVQSVIVLPRAFNAMLEKWDSKGAVLGHGLATLIGRLRPALIGDDPIDFVIDKHGGRNHYAATLQHAVPDAMIVARHEGAGRSVYEALGLNRELRFAFQPRADAEHFCVAAASMVSKYLREAMMHEFNRFWQAHVPNLRPTAGYPGDAERFLVEVEPAIIRLGIDRASIWRDK
jgi:hypothetical protein